jgi:hypothetical protein
LLPPQPLNPFFPDPLPFWLPVRSPPLWPAPALCAQSLRESHERQLGSLTSELTRLQHGHDDLRQQLHAKAGVLEVGQALASKADLQETEEKLRDRVREGERVCVVVLVVLVVVFV